MVGEQSIEDWAAFYGLDVGTALYLIVKYMMDDPTVVHPMVKKTLTQASHQEVIDAMETIGDDLENGGLARAMA